MPASPIRRLPYPDLNDPPNAPAQLQALAFGLDSTGIPRFSTPAERNARIPSPEDGMFAWVASGKLMYFYGGTWHGLIPPPPIFSHYTRLDSAPGGLSRNDNTEDSLVALTVPDPGYPYYLEADTHARTFADQCDLDVRIRAGNGATDVNLPILTAGRNIKNNIGLDIMAPRRRSSVPYTGITRVIVYAIRVGAIGSWNITAGSVQYQIIPA